MFLSDGLKKNNIILKARAKNRWDIITEMVNLAVANNEIENIERDAIVKALIEREKSMSTGIGNAIAIPHCSTAKTNDIIISIAVSQKGIDFDSIDNIPVKIVILLIVPKTKLAQHIKTLANIAKMMSNDSLREKLLTLKTSESIIKAIKKHENSKK